MTQHKFVLGTLTEQLIQNQGKQVLGCNQELYMSRIVKEVNINFNLSYKYQ